MTTLQSPKVSIITPSYNQGQFIEETIQSVLGQDYPNIEYLIVDGGSNDNTIDILKQYLGRLKWISEKDKGQADAINKGIKKTSGEIVCWLNSDDTILPGAVSKAVNLFVSNPEIKLVYGKSYFTDQEGNINGSYPTEKFDFQRLAMFNFISQPSVFFKRDAYDKVGGLNAQLNYSLDYDLWIKIGKEFQTKYLEKYLSCYRLHESSKTVDKNQALHSHKEGIAVVYSHYGWVPANRLYGYYRHLLESKGITLLKFIKPLEILIVLILTLLTYLRINRSICPADIKYLRWKNIRKLRADWSKPDKIY
ncbi:MAG: glycosyltransferase family 2 protein [Desulfobacterales bacterium]|nr:glycosyltransferase family 2 protein [Desulfobacterales bacterium]